MRIESTNLRIAILSSGLEARKDRGYENSSWNLFLDLKKEDGYNVHLYKGSGVKRKDEFIVKNFGKKKWVRWMGNKIGDTFVFEYILFALSYIFFNFFWRRKYNTLYTQEPRVAKTLYQLRFLLPGKPIICFGMGVSMEPEHYVNIADRIHIVNVEHYDNAIKQFPKVDKFSLIPNPGSISKKYNGKRNKKELRELYGIKTNKVLISVGAINKKIKRMDYVVDEACKLPSDWTLVLVGINQNEDIINMGKEIMKDRFIHLFVSPEQISELYFMSDIAVLASFYEGFPNVVLEASQNSVAPILHDCKRNRWILKTESDLLVDMSKKGALVELINSKNDDWFREKGVNVKRIYNENYSWEALRSNYIEFLGIK